MEGLSSASSRERSGLFQQTSDAEAPEVFGEASEYLKASGGDFRWVAVAEGERAGTYGSIHALRDVLMQRQGWATGQALHPQPVSFYPETLLLGIES